MTANAINFNNKMMTKMCEQFKIKHHNSVPYHYKMNRAVEAANKNLKKTIQKMTITDKDWHKMLPFPFFGYQTCIHTSTRAIPFSLIYGMEAVLLIKVKIPSLKVLMEA